jgi:hypothetical protein
VTTRNRERWVLRYLGPGRAPRADLSTIEHTVTVVDRTGTTLLVEATSDQITRLLAPLPSWTVTKERRFSLA